MGCKSNQQPRHIQEIDKITSAYVAEVTEEHDLQLFGYGGSMMYEVGEVTLAFKSDSGADVAEARCFLCELVEQLLTKINETPGIEAYLSNYPFTPENLQFGIVFNVEQAVSGEVKKVYLFRGTTNYYKADKDGWSEKFMSEPYKTSLELCPEYDKSSSK